MKNHFAKLIFLLVLVLSFKDSFAQTAQIVDARVVWTHSGSQFSGKLSVYLTDTSGVIGEKIQIGSQAGDSDLYQANYTIGLGGNFPSSGMLANSELKTNIGTFTSHPDYYAKISVLLSNGQINRIAIHSSN